MAIEVGERVGDYEVVGHIGAGGMGRVYKVRSIISNRDEAMKVLLPDLNSEHELAERFIVEIRTVAALEHPNIAQLRTAFQFQNQLIMIMEFVEGSTLEKLAAESSLAVDRVLDYATQTLSALSFAHSHGVIHRDIKPANIMITTHGQVKLMDFGIAKNADEMHLTRPGMTIGSVYYMSPEQVRGGTVDARSDLYSLGITLYESLTGRKPFQADTSFSVLNAHLNEAPVPPIQVNPALSPELNRIILRALEKSPNDRFQTAQEFHDALKALVEPAVARAAAPPMAQAPAYTPVSNFAGGPSATASFSPVSAAAATPVAQPVASAPPPFAPVAAAKPAPARSSSHRGLWIGMGAVVALLTLVAIAWALPHVFSIFAKQKSSSADTSAAPAVSQAPSPETAAPTPEISPQPNTAGQPAAPGQPDSAGAIAASDGQGKAASPQQDKPPLGEKGTGNRVPYQPAHAAALLKSGGQGSASNGSSTGADIGGGAPVPVAPTGPSPQEVRHVRDRAANVEARADAVRAGVQSIRSQQQAQGVDIRGDIIAAMNRMDNDLREAQSALNQNDLETANQYLDRADKETAKVESFLGR
jgi:eukaryotic-like serine/threonine-protein kinase